MTKNSRAESRLYILHNIILKDNDVVLEANLDRVLGGSIDVAKADAIQQKLEELRTQREELRASLEESLRRLSHKEIAERMDKQTSPPMLAEFCISFLAPKNTAQALLGDLHEMFQNNVQRFGEKQARLKYWMQVAASAGPLLWRCFKRIGLVTLLVDYFRSKLGL